MLNKPEDLNIFILTYNRAEMLEQTIISIINQTAKGFKLTILDNGSNDNTIEIIEKYNLNVHRNTTNLGQEANFKIAQQLADSKWVMLFHDDDLMHPKYIENALFYLNKYPKTVLLGSGYIAENFPENENWERKTNEIYHCNRVRDFALMLFLDFPYHFASTIYKTELFKKYFFRYDLYGKIWDRPFLLDIADHGEIMILDKSFIKYRVHSGQDSLTPTTGPYLKNWLAMHENYYKFIIKDFSVLTYVLYCIRTLDFLTAGYDWLKSEHLLISRKEFFERAKTLNIIPTLANIYNIGLKNKIFRGAFRKFDNKFKKNFINRLKV